MSIVRTKEEFKKALEAKERRIMVIGELAASMRVKAKVKKASIIGGIALIAGGVELNLSYVLLLSCGNGIE